MVDGGRGVMMLLTATIMLEKIYSYIFIVPR